MRDPACVLGCCSCQRANAADWATPQRWTCCLCLLTNGDLSSFRVTLILKLPDFITTQSAELPCNSPVIISWSVSTGTFCNVVLCCLFLSGRWCCRSMCQRDALIRRCNRSDLVPPTRSLFHITYVVWTFCYICIDAKAVPDWYVQAVLLHFLVKTPAVAGWAAGPALRFSSTLFNLFVLFPLHSRTLPLFHALNVTPNPDQPTLHCSFSCTSRRQRGFIPTLYLDVRQPLSQDPSFQWCPWTAAEEVKVVLVEWEWGVLRVHPLQRGDISIHTNQRVS